MDEILNPVVIEMIWAIIIIAKVAISPASPTIQPSRMYMITPRMVSIEGVNTPPKAPNFFTCPI